MSSHPADDSLEGLDLELYADVDRLTDEFRGQLGGPSSVDARTFARRHPAIEAVLLPALRAVEALRRTEEPPARSRSTGLAAGDHVGRFRILGELGRGGMGVVYEASEEGLERPVALKVLDGTRASDAFKQRFVREARAAARLEHPAIVPVYGTGEDEGLLWYAMRKIDGVALDQLLQGLGTDQGSDAHSSAGRALLAAYGASLDDDASTSSASASAGSSRQRAPGRPEHIATARIGQRLAAALAYAHSEGVLHRDIKPGNVLLDEAGQSHLTDFGLCKLEGEASLTEAADVIGTLRYMAPEGLTGEVDARGDIYGLGLVLFELLARRPAYPRGQRAQLIHDIERRELPPLRTLDATIPEDLERIVAKAVAKLPGERYRDADAFQADLSAFLAGKPIQARPLGLAYMLRLLVRRHRVATAVAALSLMAVVALGTGYVLQLRGLLDEVTAAKQEAVRRGALSSQQFARTQLEAGDLGAAQEILREIAPEERGWGWRHLANRIALPGPPSFLSQRTPVDAFPLATGNLVVWGQREAQVVEPGTYRRIASVSPPLDPNMALVNTAFIGVAPADAEGALLVAQALPSKLSHWKGQPRTGLTLVRDLDEAPTHLASSLAAGVAALVSGGQLYLLGLPGAEVVAQHPFKQGDNACALEVLESGDVLVGTTSGEVIRINAWTGEETLLQKHRGPVTCLLADGDELIGSGNELGGVRLYGPTLAAGLRGLTSVGQSVRFLRLKDERTVLAGLENGQVAHIDRRVGAVRYTESLFLSACVAVVDAPAAEDGGAPRLEAISAWGRRQFLRESPRPGLMVGAGAGMPSWLPGFDSSGDRAAFLSHDGFLNLVGESLVRVPCESSKAETHFRSDDSLVAAAGLVVEATTGDEVLRWVPPEGECIESRWLGNRLALIVWSPGPELPEEYMRLDLYLWDSSTPEVAPVFASRIADAIPWYRAPRVSALPDAGGLVIADAGGILRRWDVTAGEEAWRCGPVGGPIEAMQVDRAGEVVYCFGGTTKLRRISLSTGQALESEATQLDAVSRMGPRIFRLDVSSEANLVATLTTKGVVHVFDKGDGAELARYDPSAAEPFSLRFLPGGRWLSVCCSNGDILLLGHGEVPRWAASGAGFVDPEKRLDDALAVVDPERLGGREPEVLGLRTAFCVASFTRPTTLDGRVTELRRRLLRYVDHQAFERAWNAHLDPEFDTFGRFGWAPHGLYGR